MVQDGKYIAALAMRTPTGVLSALIEFKNNADTGIRVWNVLNDIAQGTTPASTTRFLDIGNSVAA